LAEKIIEHWYLLLHEKALVVVASIMASQVKSGRGRCMQMSGHEESQAVYFVSYCSCAVGNDSFSFACFGYCTTSAHSAAIMACSTSSPRCKFNLCYYLCIL
jgi:hypothetical protein